MSQLEGRVIIRTQNCNFNIDHLLLFPQIPTKACRHWAARCGLHKNPMLHLSYWELKPFHGFFPIRKLQFWVLTPPNARAAPRGPGVRRPGAGAARPVTVFLCEEEFRAFTPISATTLLVQRRLSCRKRVKSFVKHRRH